MLLYIASAIILVFTAFSLFFKTDCSLCVKIIGCGLLLMASLKYEIYRVFGGWFFAPQMPRPALLFFEALYGAFILLFFLLLLWNLYLACNWVLSKIGLPVPSHLPKGAIKIGLVILALALGCWGTWQAVKVPDPRTVGVYLPNLPLKLDGLSVVQLTDLHIGPILKKDWLAEVVARTNALEPDLIVMTGDYIDGYADEIGPELEPLANLRAKYGVFGVTGNHEYYWNMPQWKERLENLGVTMLDNEHRALGINGETMVVAGIPDLSATRFGFAGPDARQALAGAPDVVRILLSHQPKGARSYAADADLILSGHTHGGLMFFLQPLIARFNEGFVQGLYPVEGKNLYVSAGTALWNGFSCRIGVPPEITRIILRQQKTDPNAEGN